MRSFNRPLFASLWALVVAAALAVILCWTTDRRPDTDLLALLPQDEILTKGEAALQGQLAQTHQNALTVSVRLKKEDEKTLQRLQDEVNVWLKDHPDFKPIKMPSSGSDGWKTLEAAALGQMTFSDEAFLRKADFQALLSRALQKAASPLSGFIFSFTDDPLGTADAWVAERLSQWPIRMEHGVLLTEMDNETFALSFIRADNQAVMSQSLQVIEALDELKDTLKATFPDSDPVISGLALFAADAASKAQAELTLIGTLSVVGVAAIAWFWFGSLRALGLILLVSGQAFVIALATTVTLLGEVHLITLVFGTTLIGITVDYSAHYLCARLGKAEPGVSTLKQLIPSLTLALASTVVGFVLMAVTPFPGLTQMAVFCASGVIAAYVAVLLWLPFLAPKTLPFPYRLKSFANFLMKFPAFGSWPRKGQVAIILLAGLFLIGGLSQVTLRTSLKELNAPDPDLLKGAESTAALLKSPSLSQYFLIHEPDFDSLLSQEETLSMAFRELQLPAVSLNLSSDWVMSDERGARVDALRHQACESINPALTDLLGAPLRCEPSPRSEARDQWEALKPLGILPPVTFTDQGVFALGLLSGLTAENVERIKGLENPSAGIHWCNYPQKVSELLALYCERILLLWSLAALCAVLVLTWRFKKNAWRAYLPCLLGTALTTAFFGWAGWGISLFTLMASILLLGLGLDYGIFMTANPRGNERSMAAVTFAALTTLLSFGLLAFSTTPALNQFGLYIMIGELIVWGLTPFLRRVQA